MADNNVTLEEQIVVSANEAIKALENIKKSVKGVKNETSSAGSIIKKGLGALGITFSLRKTLGFLKDANQSAMDLVETANLFEVSMGKGVQGLTQYYERAVKFQNELTEKLGTNINESMNYQALFNSMSTSMGLDREVAYRISENFTKLGYDLASLYNTETDKAMQKLQSGLSGASTRPLRAFGIDITQNTLANTLSDLGIDKTIGQLSQAEKMVLRYIAVIRQASVAHGDFANTIESPANQLRIFQAQCLAFKQNVGSLWQGIYAQWMPWINGILMAINALIKVIGGFFGIKFGTSVGSVTEGLKAGAGGAGGIAKGLKDATGSAKDLKEELDLMPWDEIHNIDLGKDSSSGGGGGSSGGGGGGGGIDPSLLKAMQDYDNLMGKVENKATGIRDKIMDWLGFEKLVNEETGEIEWKLREGYQKIELIRDILGGIAVGALALKIGKLFLTPEQLKKLSDTTTGLEKLRKVAGVITIGIGAVTIAGGIAEGDLKRKLIGVLEVGAGSGMTFGLKGGVIGLTVALELTLAFSMIKWGWENFDSEAEKIYGHVEGLSVWQKITVFMSAIGKGFFEELGRAFGKENFIDDILNPWISKHTGLIEKGWEIGKLVVEAIGTGISMFSPQVAMVTIPLFLKSIWTKVVEGAKTLFEKAKTALIEKLTLLNILLITKVSELHEKVTAKIEEMKNTAINKIIALKDGAVSRFEEFKTNVGTKINELKTGIEEKFDNIKNSIKEKIEWARDRVKEAIEAIKGFFNFEWKLPDLKTPHIDVQYDTSGTLGKAFATMGLPGKPNFNVTWRKDGGFPTNGELFIAREAGPELVGTMNGRNAVANNDQIIEGIRTGVYEAVASAMSQYGGVQIEAKIEEGILLKKVQTQAKEYRMQTGKAPFPTM